jgi:hypothetical protein
MQFDDLCERFQRLGLPREGELTHPDRALVAQARSQVQQAVIDDDFLADCMALELDLIESGRPRHGLTPFAVLPDLGIRCAFGYWSPGQTAGAHEHTAWTVTALCRNTLEVQTYSRAETYRTRQLVPKNRFQATAGRVGFIFEPSIHEPRNVSSDWSLSLHITSPRDGEPAEDAIEPLDVLRPRRQPFPANSPYAEVIAARRRQRCIHQLARVARDMTVRRADELTERCFALGATKTRGLIARETTRLQPALLAAPSTYRRTHRDVALSTRRDGDMMALDVATPNGLIEALAIDMAAGDALSFIAQAHRFVPDALPGDLSGEERLAIVTALEESGILTRERSHDDA